MLRVKAEVAFTKIIPLSMLAGVSKKRQWQFFHTKHIVGSS